jgi:hypothetical protein
VCCSRLQQTLQQDRPIQLPLGNAFANILL